MTAAITDTSHGPRMGLLVPMSNTTMEAELAAWLPEGTTIDTLRIERTVAFSSPATLSEEMERARVLAASLAGKSLDLVIYGCTATGFLAGPDGDAAIADALSEAAEAPVITTARSVVDVLTHCDARDIALVTPYRDLVNDCLRTFLARGNIRVRALRGFGELTIDQLLRIEPDDVLELSRAACSDACDTLYIACSQLPTRTIIPALEQELGRPVWSSIKATAWQACRHLQVNLVN